MCILGVRAHMASLRDRDNVIPPELTDRITRLPAQPDG
jgi:hypothetical protein